MAQMPEDNIAIMEYVKENSVEKMKPINVFHGTVRED